MLLGKYRKITFGLLVVLSLTVLISACSQSTWEKQEIKAYKLEVLFPGIPSKIDKTLKLPKIGNARYIHLLYQSDHSHYAVTIVEALDAGKGFHFDKLSARSLISKGAKLLKTRTVRLGVLKGKEFLMTIKGKQMTTRMYVDFKKIYSVIVIYDLLEKAEAKKFLESFKIRK